jgi:hypothetical protein
LTASRSEMGLDEPEVAGWPNAGWTECVIVLPWLGVLVYLMSRAPGWQDACSADEGQLMPKLRSR